MSRLSPVLLIASLLVFSLAGASSAQISWQQVTDVEAGFTISFPGKPTYEATTDAATGLQTEIYKFFYTDHLLQITFAPLSKPVRTPAESNRFYSEFARQVIPPSGTILRQQKLSDGGRQYDTVAIFKDGTIFGRTRLYLRNGMYYAIAFEMYAQGGIDEREAERFLSSFSFLDTVPKQRSSARNNFPTKNVARNLEQARWYTFRSPDKDFTVEFPGKPSYQLDTSFGASSPFHRYHYFYGENIFQVSYREDPKAIAQPEQVMKEAGEVSTSRRKGWTVLRQVKLPDGSYEIESRRTSGDAIFHSRVRLYVRGKRLYYVTALNQNLVGPNKDDVARFFNSFRLL